MEGILACAKPSRRFRVLSASEEHSPWGTTCAHTLASAPAIMVDFEGTVQTGSLAGGLHGAEPWRRPTVSIDWPGKEKTKREEGFVERASLGVLSIHLSVASRWPWQRGGGVPRWQVGRRIRRYLPSRYLPLCSYVRSYVHTYLPKYVPSCAPLRPGIHARIRTGLSTEATVSRALPRRRPLVAGRWLNKGKSRAPICKSMLISKVHASVPSEGACLALSRCRRSRLGRRGLPWPGLVGH